MANWLERLAGNAADAGRDFARDIPVIGTLTGQESSATQAANQQTDSINDAKTYQEKMYRESRRQLDPYLQMGQTQCSALSIKTGRDQAGFIKI